MALLNIKDVAFKYNGTDDLSLTDINLTLDKNSMNVVIGPSGIGKTTLLNLIAGYEQPTNGTVQINEARVIKPGWERGMVFQDMALFPWLSVKDNILFGPKMRGMDVSIREKRLAELLSGTGLTQYKNSPIYALSGGLKQRVALAREFINQPPVLMLDESFSALDNATRQAMHEILLRLWRATQNCVITITHDIDEAIFLGQNVIVINGRPGSIISCEHNPFFNLDMTSLYGNAKYLEFRNQLLTMISPVSF